MPIYEYQCGDCGHRMEALQKISDAPLLDCPACHASGLVKLVSASSFRLKGGGWYETDFKTGAKRHGTQEPSGDGVAVSTATKPEVAAVSSKESAGSAVGAAAGSASTVV
ncbi:MAG: zinc ribbon domain-containing protein [Gammaproteobacteria bacterium]|nr:zinc ribbon domain-containing protein [Gammaproteobacteria bacterium]MDP2139317.1 zinc ribbon domain-containing protein [Gammaproteobacteria bacterium]MDP2346874.1 zinc ribbon domain-containing protein [Gammaproteobacteria bacterium]